MNILLPFNDYRSSGKHQILWNGLNDDLKEVRTGTYICRIKVGKLTKSIKMNLSR